LQVYEKNEVLIVFEKINLKKTIIIGIVYYVVTFLFGGIARSIMPEVMSMVFSWWIVSAIVIFLLVKYYYFKQKPENPIKIGLTLGIPLAIITFIIEVPLLVYGFGMGLEHYQMWIVWIQYLVVLISPIIAAIMK
jgi:hypothetical protein